MSSQLEQDRQAIAKSTTLLHQQIEEQKQRDALAHEVSILIKQLNDSLYSSLTNLTEDEGQYKTRAAARVHPATVNKHQSSEKLSVTFSIMFTREQKELMFTIARMLNKSPQEFLAENFGFTPYSSKITDNDRTFAKQELKDRLATARSRSKEYKREADRLRKQRHKKKRYDMPPPLTKQDEQHLIDLKRSLKDIAIKGGYAE